MTDQPVCVICATRDVKTILERGRCCPSCATRIDRDLASIVHNGDLAATDVGRFDDQNTHELEHDRDGRPLANRQYLASTSPGGTGTSGSSSAFESKPPTPLDVLAPYMASIGHVHHLDQDRTVTDVLSSWERMLRDERDLAPYGLATEHHRGTTEALAAQAARQAVAILRNHLAWIIDHDAWPLEDFAHEIHACAQAMRRFGTHRSTDRVITCPTITDQLDDNGRPKPCGNRITVRTWAPLDAHETETGRPDHTTGDTTTCRKCGAVRTVTQLMHAAGGDQAWADAGDLAAHFGISATVIRKWARQGNVARERGLYRWSDVRDMVARRHADGLLRA